MEHGSNTARPSRNGEDRWLATVFSAAERRRIVARSESSNPWFSGRFLGRPEGSVHRFTLPSSRGSRTHPWLQSVAAPRLQSTDCCSYFLCVARKYRTLVEWKEPKRQSYHQPEERTKRLRQVVLALVLERHVDLGLAR